MQSIDLYMTVSSVSGNIHGTMCETHACWTYNKAPSTKYALHYYPLCYCSLYDTDK